MKYNTKNIMLVSVIVIVLNTILFIILIQFFSPLVLGILYGITCTIVVIITYNMLSKRINKALKNLNETIDSIISEKPVQTFSMLEDNILSKLQTQLIKLSAILQSGKQREENQKNAITKVISDISHQLKTPLANLNIYSDLLKRKDITEEERVRFINHLCDQSEKLNWLLESLMKMSRLETGIISLQKQRQPLINAVLRAVDEMHEKAKSKDIDIILGEEENVMIKYDLKWTTECLSNILDNGVKYSPPHSKIKIEINKLELFCYIAISDHAIPIKENEINKLFNRFYRGDNAKDIEGVGIGLYLAREIIKKQGGYIKVRPNQDGNTFLVYLPMVYKSRK